MCWLTESEGAVAVLTLNGRHGENNDTICITLDLGKQNPYAETHNGIQQQLRHGHPQTAQDGGLGIAG